MQVQKLQHAASQDKRCRGSCMMFTFDNMIAHCLLGCLLGLSSEAVCWSLSIGAAYCGYLLGLSTEAGYWGCLLGLL